MTNPQRPRGGQWDDTVARKRNALGAANPASAVDLVGQLAALEARAVAAEGQLEQDRAAHEHQVREMEEKLRALDPWVRNLRAEYQAVLDERDALREQVATATGSLEDGARTEIAALKAERDAALADVAALTVAAETDTADLDRRWTRRVTELESAREEAVKRAAAAERAANEARQGAEEARLLRTELESAQQTVAAHKAVARAAQEEVAVLKERADLLESAQAELSTQHDKAMRSTERMEEKLQSRTADLKESKAAVDDLREQLDRARTRCDEVEREVVGLKGDAAAVAVAREQADEARRELEKLRAETAETKQALARLDEETAFARRSAESVREDLEVVTRERDAARAEAARLEEELERSREAVSSAEDAIAESAAESETSATRLAILEAEQRESVDRIADLESELATTKSRLAEAEAVEADARELEKLRSEVECGRTAISTLQSKSDALEEEVESLRSAAEERAAAAEASRETQIEAIRTRAEAEMTSMRTRIERGEALLNGMHDKLALVSRMRDEEMQRIRVGVCAAMGEGMQRLLDGMEQVLGPDMAVPGLADENSASDGAGEGRAVVEPSFDSLLSELETLRSEVEHFREVDPEAVAEAEITASIEIDVLPGADVPTMADPSAVLDDLTEAIGDVTEVIRNPAEFAAAETQVIGDVMVPEVPSRDTNADTGEFTED